MSIPKQDERTPGPWSLDESSKRKDLIYCDDATGSVVARCGGLGFEYVGRSQAECEANARFIVQACNAYGSTDALRSALAELCGEATFLLDRLSEVDFTDLEYTVRDFDGHVEPSMSRLRGFIRGIETRAALSASPAPSSEGLRTALEKIKGGSFPGATNLAIEGNWKGIVEQLQSIARTALAGVTAPSEVEGK